MSNEDVKWINDVAELEALPQGTVVVDYDSCQWTRSPDGWAFTTAPYSRALDSEGLASLHGPVAVAQLPADADAPADQTEYIAWFTGLSQQRQDAIMEEANQRNEANMMAALMESDTPVAAAVPRGMTAEQLVEVTDLVKGIMSNAHNIPQDQFPGHIALTLSRAGYHK